MLLPTLLKDRVVDSQAWGLFKNPCSIKCIFPSRVVLSIFLLVVPFLHNGGNIRWH
jgi:hypothetical protein